MASDLQGDFPCFVLGVRSVRPGNNDEERISKESLVASLITGIRLPFVDSILKAAPSLKPVKPIEMEIPIDNALLGSSLPRFTFIAEASTGGASKVTENDTTRIFRGDLLV
jgi:hypothetical protein